MEAQPDNFKNVQAGMVGINVPIPVPVGYHSFGGWDDFYLEIQQCMAQRNAFLYEAKVIQVVA